MNLQSHIRIPVCTLGPIECLGVRCQDFYCGSLWTMSAKPLTLIIKGEEHATQRCEEPSPTGWQFQSTLAVPQRSWLRPSLSPSSFFLSVCSTKTLVPAPLACAPTPGPGPRQQQNNPNLEDGGGIVKVIKSPCKLVPAGRWGFVWMLGAFVNLQSAHAVNHRHSALPWFGLWDGLLLTWWTYWSCYRGALYKCVLESR